MRFPRISAVIFSAVLACAQSNHVSAQISNPGVTSVAFACGTAAIGSPITTSGTFVSLELPNLQTGANYPFANGDCGKLVLLSNAANQIPTIGAITASGNFQNGWFVNACNIAAGTQTITPTTSTIGNAATYVLAAGTRAAPSCVTLVADNVAGDYRVIPFGGAPTAAQIGAVCGSTTQVLFNNAGSCSGFGVWNGTLLKIGSSSGSVEVLRLTDQGNTPGLGIETGGFNGLNWYIGGLSLGTLGSGVVAIYDNNTHNSLLSFNASAGAFGNAGLASTAAGVVKSTDGNVTNLREFLGRSYEVGGTAPTNSGSCAITSQTGGNTAGTFTASGACAGGTYILAFAFTAATGWACDARDRTTPADNVNQTASSTTSATFTATTANNDVVQFKCMAF